MMCPGRHTFNRAREGYVDLLPPGHGSSRARGDTREMVQARRRVFQAGHFAAVADALASAVVARVRGAASVTVLDAGCGDGYYLKRVTGALHDVAPDAATCILGFDISRDALRLAARAHKDACFFVNDVRHAITVGSDSVDVLLDIFAPRNAREFSRVLRDQAALFIVVPSPDHLAELRAITPLLRIDADKRERIVEQLAPDCQLFENTPLRYAITATPADVVDLVRMSPSSHHLDFDSFRTTVPRGALELTVAVELLEFRRTRVRTH
jgi:23S rRNA (guanine745-N1)-methyltransferase